MELSTGVLGALVPKLGHLLKKEYGLQKSVRGGIRLLICELEQMHAALKAVSNVPVDKLNENVKLWARDVRNMSYDIEDTVDSFLVRVEGNNNKQANMDVVDNINRFISKTLNLISTARIRRKIAVDIKDIMESVKQLDERRRRYNVDGISPSPPTPAQTSYDRRMEAMYNKVTELVGIDKSRGRLINMLNNNGGDDEASKKSLKSVSVVGVGGLGKTTVAKAVYDRLKSEFECWAFVSVGQNPDPKKVLKDILFELDSRTYKDLHNLTRDERHLVDLLQGFLEEKRYLIVIDDIWDKKSLRMINLALFDNNCGSRIIITTRKLEVVQGASHVYILEPLSSDDSKQLLYTRIFHGERNCQDNQPDDELTKNILKKCGGIPLAIITMASLLAGKPREQWFEVYNSIGIRSKGNNSEVDTTTEILSLSYYDMPWNLRTCLLYLTIFPEDYIFDKESLIWMWIAEGFIVPVKHGADLLELGESYLNELINRSMIQPWQLRYLGKESEFRLHDMVLELMRSFSRQENFVTILENEQDTLPHLNVVRRLSKQNMRVQQSPEAAVDMTHVRSFVAYSSSIANTPPFGRFGFLRVLALENCEARNNQLAPLGKLVHLRYLRLKGISTISELPKGIGDLKFLQTLDLKCTCWKTGDLEIGELPSTISKLTQLLCLRGHFRPDGQVIEKLTSLQELQILSSINGLRKNNMLQFCEALGNLRELRVLHACFDEIDDSEQDALLAPLRDMSVLRHLNIRHRPSIKVDQFSRWHAPGAVLPQHIQVLSLSGLEFSSLPGCINSSVLPNLSDLFLKVEFIDYRGMRIIGKFPLLSRLRMHTSSRMMLLVVCGGDGYFRKLTTLELSSPMPTDTAFVMFKGREFGTPVMPNLEELQFGFYTIRLQDFCDHHCQDISWLLSMIGWHHLPLLKNVSPIVTQYHEPNVVEEMEVALSQTASSHPNRPSIRGMGMQIAGQRPNDSPKVLDLPVHVWMFKDTRARFDFSNLASLERVTAHIYCLYATPSEVLQAEEALRHAVDAHPNEVVLEVERLGQDEIDIPTISGHPNAHPNDFSRHIMMPPLKTRKTTPHQRAGAGS